MLGVRPAYLFMAALLLILIGHPALADYSGGAKAFGDNDYVAALAAWQPLADEGHLRAQFGIAVIYENGGGGVEVDIDKAIALYRNAAEQGLADAQYNLGNLYRSGRGIEKDPWRAVFWYLKAAIQNMPLAQFNLALSYETGNGTAKNYTVAAKWYRRAVKQGDVPAMLGLAALYRDGLGVARDHVAAVAMYRKVIDAGNLRGRRLLDAMTAEDQAQAAKLAPPNPVATLVEPEAQSTAEPPPTARPVVAVPLRESSAVQYGVQLAAHRSRKGALAAWDTLRTTYAGLLWDIEVSLLKTTLADNRGVVYRLVVGQFATKSEAGRLCRQIKQRGVDCFVPRP